MDHHTVTRRVDVGVFAVVFDGCDLMVHSLYSNLIVRGDMGYTAKIEKKHSYTND
jgi:hypothetical protein